jgi:hypothetical protein
MFPSAPSAPYTHDERAFQDVARTEWSSVLAPCWIDLIGWVYHGGRARGAMYRPMYHHLKCSSFPSLLSLLPSSFFSSLFVKSASLDHHIQFR